MSDPTPLTERELIERQQDDIDELVAENDRLLATVDAERARANKLNDDAIAADALRSDREAERDKARSDERFAQRSWTAALGRIDQLDQQLGAERARADQAEAALALADRALRDQPMQAFRTRAAQMRRAHAIDAVRRALDASPTEGNPE